MGIIKSEYIYYNGLEYKVLNERQKSESAKLWLLELVSIIKLVLVLEITVELIILSQLRIHASVHIGIDHHVSLVLLIEL